MRPGSAGGSAGTSSSRAQQAGVGLGLGGLPPQALLEPALQLDLLAARGAVREVGQRPLAGRVAELAVDECGEVVPGVSAHTPSSRAGARWASAARRPLRPRWMRLRTVPILMPSTDAISS